MLLESYYLINYNILYLECYCKKIYVSPTSNVKNNCGAFSRKCKTFEDAVTITLRDEDQTNIIILDGGNTERTIYNVRFNQSRETHLAHFNLSAKTTTYS